MFGVKSSNKPISGHFAEEFCQNLLLAKDTLQQDEEVMSHTIVND